MQTYKNFVALQIEKNVRHNTQLLKIEISDDLALLRKLHISNPSRKQVNNVDLKEVAKA